MTNTVAYKAESPDGRSSALLVERYYHAALNANQLIIVSRERDTSKAMDDKDIGDSSALIATSARQVKLTRRDNRTLIVTCDSCGVEAIDISKRLDQLGTTSILYQGFPKHTAYS